eukprot:GFUD01083156.1.p1 GENE.GFUD01083156.1~~GFUD01083156.1.p1  ORF type:complete len:451 (-),score=169.54 GFUD01083156.1:83-1435(-)
MAATSTGGLPTVPLHAPLSAKYKDTFAYPTIKDRCPVILCKVIDHLHRERNNIGRELGAEAMEGLYKVVEELSKLRYEMQTNKPILALVDGVGNAAIWNKFLEQQQTNENMNSPSWFSSAWLWVECYMYRRITQAVNLTGVPQLKGLDYFRQQKEEGYHGSLPSMRQLSAWLLPQLAKLSPDTQLADTDCGQTWATLVQVCLWGNKCDLSISAGSKAVASGDPVTGLEHLKQNILTDHTSVAWQCLVTRGKGATIDIVMDNSGFELFTDLCLADFLVSCGAASKVRMRVKDQPWFVSDTTMHDITWTLNQLARGVDNTDTLVLLADRWSDYMQSGIWTVQADSFWTFPHSFNMMADTDPDLYIELGQADLVIFKGDLNYRKLVGDLNWETTVTLRTALQGFLPTSILSLRTAKADVMVGLEPGQAEMVTKQDPDWMVTGQWGVVQFASSS